MMIVFLLARLLLILSTFAVASSSSLSFDQTDGINNELLVSVRFFGEAQCPYCRKFVTEAWPPIWEDAELRALVDYDFVPWGNAYFGTDDCGVGPYSSTERACWYETCINVHSADERCFSGDPVYQHSTKEGQVDIYETCVKAMYGLEAAVDFTYCCEGPNMDDETLEDAKYLMQHCLSDDKGKAGPIQICLEQFGRDFEITNAVQTPEHSGVPYVLVDGEALDNPFFVKNAICASLAGKDVELPQACKNIDNEDYKALRTTGPKFTTTVKTFQ
jgi:hypothetical protein